MPSKIPSDYKHNGLTYQEWQSEGRNFYVENGGLKGWKNRFWVRPDGEELELFSKKRSSGPKKTPDDVLARGGHMQPRKTSTSKDFKNKRRSREEVPERLRSRFESDEAFEEYKRYVKRGNTANQQRARLASKGGTKFNKGHIAAVGAGGSHDPMAQRLESESGNKSSQNIDEIPPDRLAATGTPRNWDEAVTYYQNPEFVPKELTPKDKQRIWRGEDPDVVYREAAERIKNNPLAKPNANRLKTLIPENPPNRTTLKATKKLSKWLPLAGAVAPLVQSGQAFAQGRPVEGIVHAGEAALGEVPIVGDAATELIAGSPVAHGTLEGAQREQQEVQRQNRERLQRKQHVKDNPESERGYETLQRMSGELQNHLKYALKNPLSIFGIR